MCWFVADADKKKMVTFEALDTDTQIAVLKMLNRFLDYHNWQLIE